MADAHGGKPWNGHLQRSREHGLISQDGGVVDWLLCRDARWRPVEPGTCPLVDASPARLGRLRLYGDAIDVEAFTNLIGAYLDAEAELSSQSRAA
jgi:DNA (cytosine-5)-methyltransferase 1